MLKFHTNIRKIYLRLYKICHESHQKIAATSYRLVILFKSVPTHRGAGIEIDQIDLANYHVRVKMPLTRKNQNIVGVHFGGSLYSMVDRFYMLILMHHLGSTYIVWDKAATIHFLAPGRSTVYADIRLSAAEVEEIKQIAEDYAPRHVNIRSILSTNQVYELQKCIKRYISDVKSP